MVDSQDFNYPSDLDPSGLSTEHRLAIADCIMAWARFECMFRAMLSAVENRDLLDGADTYDRLGLKLGWRKLRKALRERGASEEVLKVVKQHSKDYEKHAEVRHNLAHAGCVGVWKQAPEYIVLAPFQRFGSTEMLVLRVPIEEIEKSTRWADAARQMAHRITETAGH